MWLSKLSSAPCILGAKTVCCFSYAWLNWEPIYKRVLDESRNLRCISRLEDKKRGSEWCKLRILLLSSIWIRFLSISMGFLVASSKISCTNILLLPSSLKTFGFLHAHIYLFCLKDFIRLRKNKRIYVQGVLALCEFHYCGFHYCGFSKLLQKFG